MQKGRGGSGDNLSPWGPSLPVSQTLLRFPPAFPKFSWEVPNSAEFAGQRPALRLPSASSGPRWGPHEAAAARGAGRRQSNSGATRWARPDTRPSQRGRRRAHAPRRPNAAPSLEKSGGGCLGFCVCRKARKRAKDSEKNRFTLFRQLRHSPQPRFPHTAASQQARLRLRPWPGPVDSGPGPSPRVCLSQRREGPGIPNPARFHLLNRSGSDLSLASLPRGCESHRHVAAVTTIGKSGALRVNGKLGERRRPLGLNHLGNAGRGDAPGPSGRAAGQAWRRHSGPGTSRFCALWGTPSPGRTFLTVLASPDLSLWAPPGLLR